MMRDGADQGGLWDLLRRGLVYVPPRHPCSLPLLTGDTA